MAKVKAPPPDPAFGRAQEAASRTAQEAENRAAENDRFYKEFLLPKFMAQTDEQIALGREESKRQTAMSDYAMGRAKKYDAIQDDWINEVETFDTEANRERMAGMAVAEVNQAIGEQRGQTQRSLARMGINPNSGAYMGTMAGMETSAALGKAAAANMAREAARREGMQLRASASGMGSSYLGQAGGFGMQSIGALGSGMSALQGMQGAQGANASQWTSMAGFGMQTLGDAANRGFQQQQMKFQANQANAAAMNQMIGAGMGAMMSDRRLKTDIVRVGSTNSGLGVYSYRYIWGGPTHIGVMADEVRRVKPQAVIRVGGFDAVDYSQL